MVTKDTEGFRCGSPRRDHCDDYGERRKVRNGCSTVSGQSFADNVMEVMDGDKRALIG